MTDKALQSSEPVATAVYEIYAGLDNWREVSKAEYDDYKRTKRMLVPANANDFCYAELQAIYDEMYVHKDVARVANQLYKLIHSRTLPPSTVPLEEHNKRIAELEEAFSIVKKQHMYALNSVIEARATNKTLLDALKKIASEDDYPILLPQPNMERNANYPRFLSSHKSIALKAIADVEGVEG